MEPTILKKVWNFTLNIVASRKSLQLSSRTKIATAAIATSAALNLNLALPAAGQTYGKFSYYGTITNPYEESGAVIIPPGFSKGSFFSGEFYGAITDANPEIFGVRLNSEILNTSCCLSPLPSAFSGVLQADSSNTLIGRIYLKLSDSSYLDNYRQPIVGKSIKSYFSTGPIDPNVMVGQTLDAFVTLDSVIELSGKPQSRFSVEDRVHYKENSEKLNQLADVLGTTGPSVPGQIDPQTVSGSLQLVAAIFSTIPIVPLPPPLTPIPGPVIAEAAETAAIATEILGDSLLLASKGTELLSQDPPDLNFTEITQPIFSPSALLPLKVNYSVNQPLADSFNALLENLTKANGVQDALITSLNRADGALLANNLFWENEQVQAANAFRLRLGTLVDAQPQLFINVANAYRAIPGLSSIETSGRPQGNVRFPDVLEDPELISSLKITAQTLKQGVIQPGNSSGTTPTPVPEPSFLPGILMFGTGVTLYKLKRRRQLSHKLPKTDS